MNTSTMDIDEYANAVATELGGEAYCEDGSYGVMIDDTLYGMGYINNFYDGDSFVNDCANAIREEFDI